MHNLFRYETEHSPAYNCGRILKKWDVVKNAHLLYEALDEYFHGRLVMVRTQKPEKRPSPLWRLTLPVWAVTYVLIAFVVLPLKWLFTGEYLMSHRSKAFTWFRWWAQRIFPGLMK